MTANDEHVSRGWGRDMYAGRTCPCPPLPCGHASVEQATILGCPQHALGARQTLRSCHPVSECPTTVQGEVRRG